MVKRRAQGDPTERGTAILVEDMRSQFRVFGEALEGMRTHFDARFDGVDARLEMVDREVGLLKSAVLENSREIRAGLQRLDEKKVDRDEIDGIIARAVGQPSR